MKKKEKLQVKIKLTKLKLTIEAKGIMEGYIGKKRVYRKKFTVRK